MIDWLLLPISGAAQHTLPANIAWHGRVMVLAWGLIVPLCVLGARYWKITPGQRWPEQLDHKAWWRAHLFGQLAGAALTVVGVSLVARNTSALAFHGLMGWTIVVLAAWQVLHGLLRGSKGGPTDAQLRGDHYDMTPRRLLFERAHKALGWLALALSIAAIVSGLLHADAPRWMLGMIGLWWMLLLVLGLRWQRAGRCIDTYQAIWGTSLKHPGNASARQPIGWRVKRYPPSR
jgi:hypothetical protein